jgi:hypothetical protein
VKIFTCNQNNCARTYSSLKILYRHIAEKHCASSCNKSIDITTQSGCCVSEHGDIPDLTPDSSETVGSEDETFDCDLSELSYVLNLYSELSATRSSIDRIIQNTKILFEKKKSTFDVTNQLNTEYKRIQILKRLNLWIEPKTIVLGYKEGIRKVDGAPSLHNKAITCQYIGLKKIFEVILNIPFFLDLATKYISQKIDCLADIEDGTLCRDIEKGKLPFLLFYDELETCNPLGSHKTIYKIGAIYVSLRCFPPFMCSALEQIFQCAIFPSKGREHFDTLLEVLVNDIIELCENGIVVNNNRYHFYFVGVTGDNLGQHQILGFVESFVANYPCRVCRATREVCSSLCNEDSLLLRNPTNYEEDVAIGNQSETGIKNVCVFNRIPGYHVTQNILLDCMHDICEGVAQFGMCSVIHFYVTSRLIDISTINFRIKCFPVVNVTNKPPPVKVKSLEKGDLGYSASETLTLVLYLA